MKLNSSLLVWRALLISEYSVCQISVSWGEAIYSYSAGSADEVSLIENTQVPVVDDLSDPDWLKIEDQGRIGLAPRAYIEIGG